MKNHETLITIPPIGVYINRSNNRLVFKIKGRYKLELQTPEIMKLFGSTKNLDNQHQQKSELLHTFTPNKYYAYLLNV